METSVALAGPAFLVAAPRVRGEQHAIGLEGRGEVPEDPRELAARHMEQRGVREDPVESGERQVEREEVLVQHLAIRLGARHGDELARSVQTDHNVAECGEPAQVPAGPATQIENDVGSFALNCLEQGCDVLAHIVIGGAAAVRRRHAIIFRDRDGRDLVRLHRSLLPGGKPVLAEKIDGVHGAGRMTASEDDDVRSGPVPRNRAPGFAAQVREHLDLHA